MRVGTVLQQAVLRKDAPFLTGRRFVMVKLGLCTVAALDEVGAVPGERVLLLTGAAADRVRPSCPADAVVVAVLESDPAQIAEQNSGENP